MPIRVRKVTPSPACTAAQMPLRLWLTNTTLQGMPAGQRLFDRHYKSGGRSDNFIQFHILAGKPRSREQKQNFCRLLCDRLHAALGIHPDDVMVMIHFNTADDWSFSQGRMLSEEGL